jgi:hypothetical protein
MEPGAEQELDVGLLHYSSMTGARCFIRFDAFPVTDSTVICMDLADTTEVFCLQVDYDGDGEVDFLWYPGEQSGVEDASSSPRIHSYVTELTTLSNPTSQSVKIAFTAHETLQDVEIYISDVTGRRVRTIPVGEVAGGRRQVIWDGRTGGGVVASSGTYYWQVVHQEGRSAAEKIVVLQ